jgi:hypothetical protein
MDSKGTELLTKCLVSYLHILLTSQKLYIGVIYSHRAATKNAKFNYQTFSLRKRELFAYPCAYPICATVFIRQCHKLAFIK